MTRGVGRSGETSTEGGLGAGAKDEEDEAKEGEEEEEEGRTEEERTGEERSGDESDTMMMNAVADIAANKRKHENMPMNMYNMVTQHDLRFSSEPKMVIATGFNRPRRSSSQTYLLQQQTKSPLS